MSGEADKIGDDIFINPSYRRYTEEYYILLIFDSEVHYQALIDHLSGYINKQPNNAIAWHNRGLACLELGMEIGLADLKRSIEIDDTRSEPHRVLGMFWERNNNFERALEHYGNALSLNSRDPGLYKARSGIYERMGEFRKAIEEISRAILLNPSFKNYYLARSELYLKTGEIDKAVADKETADGL